jgi:uncharacterized membrane protein YccC
MSDQESTQQSRPVDIRDLIRQTLEEFARIEQQKAEPAYKAELHEERKRREELEQRLNQLVEENRRARAAAEEAERYSQIRTELQRLGVAKLDLAFKAVKDEIIRGEDGRLQSRGPDSKPLRDYLAQFVQENPELLPARIAGGSGIGTSIRKGAPAAEPTISLEQIKPGMTKEDLEKVRQEISRLATQVLRGS